MKPTPVRIAAAVFLSAFLLLSLSLIDALSGHGQEPKAAATGDAYSAIHCIGCHGGPDTPAYKAYAEDKKNNPTQFVRLTEYHTWHDEDLHSKAFANIEPSEKDANLAWKMQQVLAGSPSRGADYRVDRAAECLTCHSVDRKPGPLANATPDRFHTTTGVGCEACHGFAKDWFGPHVQATWRDVAPDEKGKLGLVDLRDPYTRAMKCASCHVGNKEEGKFVTHEMYAAGHPPLPPFELVTYCRESPRHYFTHRENRALVVMKPEQQARLHFREPEKECPEARNLAIGTLAGFETTMHLLECDAAEAAKSGDLLDFAHFDCYACHHDLQAEGDRKPQAGLRPGRPTMRPSSTDTLQVVLKHGESAPGPKVGDLAQQTAMFDDGFKKLNAAFDARPFGDAASVSTGAKTLADLCGKVHAELSKIEYSPAETRRLYDLMAARVRNSVSANFDHDTAQQLAWALLVLRNELRDAKDPGIANHPKSFDGAEEKLNAIVALGLRGKPGEPIGPRVRARQEEISKFRSSEFVSKADDFLKAIERK